jgi:hypothetical protein
VTPAQQHRNWRSDVAGVVAALEHRYPRLECITYVDHPYPGWDGRSFDVWRDAQTWTPAHGKELHTCKRWLMGLPWGPYIRHTILGHVLWTSFGGRSVWVPDDHSREDRHLHVTYW